MVSTRPASAVPGQRPVAGRRADAAGPGARTGPAGGQRARPVPVALALLAVAAATLTAGLVVTRIYAGTQLPVLLVGAALGAVLLTALLRALRTGPVLTVVGGLAGLAACLVGATAALRDPSGGLAAALLDAVRNSGARILTSAIPVPAEPDTVVLPIAATWLAGAVGGVLLGPIRPDDASPADERGPVRRRAALAAVPSTVLLVGGLVLVGPNGAPSYPLLAGFVLAVALLLVVSGQPWAAPATAAPVAAESRRALRVSRLRRAGAAGVVLAVLAVAAVLGGPGLAGLVRRAPVDPRSYVVPPHTQLDQLNPLGMLGAWALDPTQHLLTVRTDHPERIQWATLSTYDGISWQPDRTYRSAGAVLPPPPATGDRSTTVHQRVTVDALGGGWLPAVPRVREVRGVRVGFDAASGSVLTPDGLTPGLAYDTVSVAPQPDPAVLATASVPTSGTARYLAVPEGLDPAIAALAQQNAAAGTPYHRALLLEQLLRTRYRYWSKAPSGNGYVTLQHFLTVPRSKGGGTGTSEQFATGFALLARIVGLPTRVVVGFHAGHRIAGGRYQVTSGDAFAWPEVLLAGHGWVAFDPTPTAGKGATPPDEDTPQAKSQQKQKSQQLDDSAPTPNPSAPVPSASASGTAAGATGTGAVGAGLAGGGSAALLLVVLLVAVVLLRRRRTGRRLDTGPPADRILGAWAEVRDALRLAGLRAGPALSVAEVSRLAGAIPSAVPAAPPLTDLGPLAGAVNAVAFGTGGHLTDTDAGTAAGTVRDYTRRLRGRLGRLRRVVWRLDPRPLFWR